MKQLILITKSYPYDYGEEFLENEIEFLAQKFEHITVFATSVNDESIKRAVPENVSCVPMNIKTRRVLPGAGINYICADKRFASKRDIAEAKKNDYNKKALAFFIAKSKLLYKKIKNYIDFLQDGEIVIYSFWLYDTACAAVMLKNALEKRGCKVTAVSRAHRYDLYEYAASHRYIPLREYILKNLDAIYPCSDNGTEYLKERFPDCCASRVKTEYLGVKDNGISKETADDVFTIVSCAYISPVKRVERLAQSLCLIQNDFKLRWVHLGGGAQLEDLKAFCRDNLNNIEFDFKGSVKNSEIIEFYKTQKADLFVNTSASEGLPVSIMEAQSFGIPVVATDVGGSGEIVKNDVTGYLIKADFTNEELANAIAKTASLGREEYEKLRQNARNGYLENFYADKNYSRFADMLARL